MRGVRRILIISALIIMIVFGPRAIKNIFADSDRVIIATATPIFTPTITPTVTPFPAVVSSSLVSLEADLISRLNAERAVAGLSVLLVDGNLVAIARIRSNDMADRGLFQSHQSGGSERLHAS